MTLFFFYRAASLCRALVDHQWWSSEGPTLHYPLPYGRASFPPSFYFFIILSVHLSVRPSVRPSIRPSVHPSIDPSVRLIVHHLVGQSSKPGFFLEMNARGNQAEHVMSSSNHVIEQSFMRTLCWPYGPPQEGNQGQEKLA